MSFRGFAQQGPRQWYWQQHAWKLLDWAPVIDCSVMRWGVMIPQAAAIPLREEKWACQEERKEKDRKEKIIPPLSFDVLFGCGSAFRGQVSAQIKMHLFHQTSREAACQLSGSHLFTGRRDPAYSERGLRAGRRRPAQVCWSGDCAMHCAETTPGDHLLDQRTFFITVTVTFLSPHKMSLMIAGNPFPGERD